MRLPFDIQGPFRIGHVVAILHVHVSKRGGTTRGSDEEGMDIKRPTNSVTSCAGYGSNRSNSGSIPEATKQKRGSERASRNANSTHASYVQKLGRKKHS